MGWAEMSGPCLFLADKYTDETRTCVRFIGHLCAFYRLNQNVLWSSVASVSSCVPSANRMLQLISPLFCSVRQYIGPHWRGVPCMCVRNCACQRNPLWRTYTGSHGLRGSAPRRYPLQTVCVWVRAAVRCYGTYCRDCPCPAYYGRYGAGRSRVGQT